MFSEYGKVVGETVFGFLLSCGWSTLCRFQWTAKIWVFIFCCSIPEHLLFDLTLPFQDCNFCLNYFCLLTVLFSDIVQLYFMHLFLHVCKMEGNSRLYVLHFEEVFCDFHFYMIHVTYLVGVYLTHFVSLLDPKSYCWVDAS